ncbi:MAG: J domain-containing protein [Actinobacteria bacterium]|nr:J domain-containing protein [Actinomycetota bacterium]
MRPRAPIRFLIAVVRKRSSRSRTAPGLSVSRKLARSTFMLMGRYQAKLENKQAVLGRIVDIGAELFAIACACVYADTIAREQPGRREEAFALADLFAKQARRRAEAETERLGSLLKVLGVELGASQKDIDTAYKKKAKTYHPDRVASLAPEVREMAELRMKEINAAYTELRRRAR